MPQKLKNPPNLSLVIKIDQFSTISIYVPRYFCLFFKLSIYKKQYVLKMRPNFGDSNRSKVKSHKKNISHVTSQSSFEQTNTQ